MENNSKEILKINKPCSENWDTMKIGINSRHCFHCNKSVVDFTKKSKKEIFEYLEQKKNKSICGKVTKNQLDFETNYQELIIEHNKNHLSYLHKFSIYTFAISGALIFNSCNSLEKEKGYTIEKTTSYQKNSLINKSQQLSKIDCKLEKDTIESGVVEIMGDMIIENEETSPYRIVDKHPVYTGGNKEFETYIKKKINVDSLNGKVYCYFVVDKVGKVKDIRLRSNFGHNIDKKLKTILKNMPNWKPGKKDGEIVETVFTLPIIFK